MSELLQKALEMSLEGAGHFLDWFKSAAECLVIPERKEVLRGIEVRLFPELQKLDAMVVGASGPQVGERQ